MLLRAYRVTDRVGVVFLKISTQTGAVVWVAFNAVLTVVRGGFRGVVTLLLLIVAMFLAGLRVLGRSIGWIVMHFWALLKMIGGLFVRGTSRAVREAGSRVSSSTSDVMARRVARSDIDVRIAEDPLKAQNRRLSVVVLVMGFAIIAVLLWATDPARTTVAPLVSSNGDVNPLALNVTIEPTVETALLGLPTPIPVATQVPLALRGGGTMAYTVRERGQTDLWLAGVASRNAIRLTNSPTDERDPVWSSDGSRLAYASREDGNWEIYVYDLPSQQTARITFDLSFQGNPTFSPDGLYVAYESYQGENIDIYAVPVDGSAPATRITDVDAPDFSPSWSYDGRRIAFVSSRNGANDLYVINLDTLETTNVSNTPLQNEDHPSWSRDGLWIAYSALDAGVEKVFVIPSAGGQAQAINFGRTPSWSPDGLSLTFAVDSTDGTQSYVYAVPFGGAGSVSTEVLSVPMASRDPVWSERPIPPSLINAGSIPLGVEPLYVARAEEAASGAPYRLNALPDVTAPSANLSDLVDESFNAMRSRLAVETNIDFFGTLDDAFWDLERLPNPGEERRSWHMTGRGIAFERSALLGFPPAIEILREERGINTYWRVMLRVDEDTQSGELGEPLRQVPWDFLSATQGDVEAYNQGGRYRGEVPDGYYVDVTQLALDYGWEWLPTGDDWRANVATRNFWMLIKPEGLSWCDAMLQIYTAGEMVNFCGG